MSPTFDGSSVISTLNMAIMQWTNTIQTGTCVPYCSKFSRVFNFANLANFPLFVKIFQRKFLTRDTHTFHTLTATASMDNILGLSCRIRKELSPKRYLQSRHCFADSCRFEHDDTRLVCHAHSILHVWCVCAANLQNYFNEIFKPCYSQKLRPSKI